MYRLIFQSHGSYEFWEPTSLEKVGGLSTMSISKIGFVSEKDVAFQKELKPRKYMRLYVLNVRQHEACLIGMYPMDWSTLSEYTLHKSAEWERGRCVPK